MSLHEVPSSVAATIQVPALVTCEREGGGVINTAVDCCKFSLTGFQKMVLSLGMTQSVAALEWSLGVNSHLCERLCVFM